MDQVGRGAGELSFPEGRSLISCHRAISYILCCSKFSSLVMHRRQVTKFISSTNWGRGDELKPLFLEASLKEILAS